LELYSCGRTGDCVSDQGADEQDGEGDEQAVLVELEPRPTATHRPWRVFVVAMVPWDFITAVVVFLLGLT
jgi:hypothetical protein